MRSVACLLLFLLVHCRLAQAQTAKEILTRYFTLIGGIERLQNFKSTSHRSIHIQHYPRADTTFISVDAKSPYSFRFTRSRNNHVISQAFGNEEGQTMFVYQPYRTTQKRSKTNVPLSTAHELLLAYSKNKIKRLPDTLIHQTQLLVIQTTASKKLLAGNRKYFFDRDSFELIGFSSGNDFTTLENYQVIDHLRLPMSSKYYVNEKLITGFQIESMAVNPLLHDSLFVPTEIRQVSIKKIRLNRNISYIDEKLGSADFQELMSNYKGKFVLVDLWASWCGPCREEFKFYDDALFHFLKSKGIEIVYISFDRADKEQEWKNAINQFILSGQHLRAGKKLSQSIQKEIAGSESLYIPRTILIGKNGEIVSAELPKLSSGFFYTKIEELISAITP